MNGQWTGTLHGNNPGLFVLNIEDRAGRFAASGMFFPKSTSIPYIQFDIVNLVLEDSNPIDQKFILIDRYFNSKISKNECLERYGEFSTKYDYLQFSINKYQGEIEFSLHYTDQIRVNGKLHNRYCKDNATMESGRSPSQASTWEEFRECIFDGNMEEYIFRGQREPWYLTTSFHRTGRNNLVRYFDEDLPRLRQLAISLFPNYFVVNDSDTTSSLCYLGQHHGFPTPLLDWTNSPYIAAYFAFCAIPESHSVHSKNARIFRFRKSNLLSGKNIIDLKYSEPTIRISEFVAFNNNRAIPQQAVSMSTNIADLERYISDLEGDGDNSHEEMEPLLTAFDIPWSERPNVMKDLRMMGITAAALFPGMDGICQELKDRWFS